MFPCDYFSEWEKLGERQLPPISQFCTKLKEQSILQSEYEHVQSVWDRFKIYTLGEYSDPYIKIYILFLSDIYKNLKDTTMKNYGLDAA